MARSEARVRVFSSQRPFVVVEISRSPLWDFLPGRCSQGANFRFGITEKPLKTPKNLLKSSIEKTVKILKEFSDDFMEVVVGRVGRSGGRGGGGPKLLEILGAPSPFCSVWGRVQTT